MANTITHPTPITWGSNTYNVIFSRYPNTNNVIVQLQCSSGIHPMHTITRNMLGLFKQNTGINVASHRFAAIGTQYDDVMIAMIAANILVHPVIDAKGKGDSSTLLVNFHDDVELPDNVPVEAKPEPEPEQDLKDIKKRETTGPQDFVNQLTAELKSSAIDQLCRSSRARIECRDFPRGNELAIIIYLDGEPLIGSSLKGTTVDGGHGMLCHTTSEPKQLATMIQGSTRAKSYE